MVLFIHTGRVYALRPDREDTGGKRKEKKRRKNKKLKNIESGVALHMIK